MNQHDENCNPNCDGHHPMTWPQVVNNALEMLGVGSGPVAIPGTHG